MATTKKPGLKKALVGLVVLGLIVFLIWQGWNWSSQQIQQVKINAWDIPSILSYLILWNIILTCFIIFIYEPNLLKSLVELYDSLLKLIK